MRAKTQTTSAAIRARYGEGARYLTSVQVSAEPDNFDVQIFDGPGPRRVYAWLDPAREEVILVEHGGMVSSPRAAVLKAAAA